MDANVVNQFLVANAKYFPEEQVPFLKQKLLDASDDKLTLVQCRNSRIPRQSSSSPFFSAVSV